jgi:predicted nucleic acid-binding protein
MKQKVVDANCFLRFLLNDIPEQAEEVEKLLSEAKNSKNTLFVPQIVLF